MNTKKTYQQPEIVIEKVLPTGTSLNIAISDSYASGSGFSHSRSGNNESQDEDSEGGSQLW